MTKPRLTYFDAPVSRGEECRLALFLAGVDFEDRRLNRPEWLEQKPTTPFGAVPVLELPGHPPLGQTNAILVLLGTRHGLHPRDDFESARHQAVMERVEDLRWNVTPSMRASDEGEKRRLREQLASDYLPTWARFVEPQIQGPFFAGTQLQVVDIKLHMTVRWLSGGALDHIPTSVFAPFPKLMGVHDAVRAHPKVQEWLARSA